MSRGNGRGTLTKLAKTVLARQYKDVGPYGPGGCNRAKFRDQCLMNTFYPSAKE